MPKGPTPYRPIRTAAACCLTLFLPVACGGGGGGSAASSGGTSPSTDGPSSSSPPQPALSLTATPVGTPIETAEYDRQNGLSAIGAASAYGRGFTGYGQAVSVVDSGLDISHPEFAGRILAGGWDYQADAPVSSDPHGHGSHVAGIIAANRDGTGMHGVAFNAGILPFRILAADGTVSGALSDQALPDIMLRAAANGSRIINHSWGSSTAVTALTQSAADAWLPRALPAFQTTALSNGQIQVWATGNDGRDQPSVEAGLPYWHPELKDIWVAVTATDGHGTEASYANRCGVARDWCIAAPGGDGGTPITSVQSGGGYANWQGTSMAAPHVAGSLAVLLEAFPELTSQQVVDRLFATASLDGLTDRDGNPGTAEVFGHGLIDLDKASQPLGALSLVTGASYADGTPYAPDGTTFAAAGAFGDALSRGMAGQTVAAFDSQGAAFPLPLARMTHPTPDSRFDTSSALERLGGRQDLTIRPLPHGRGMFAFGAPLDEAPQRHGSGARLSLTTEGGPLTWTATRNISPADGFGLRQTGDAFPVAGTFATPWLGWAEQGQALALSTPGPHGGHVKIAGFSGAAPEASWQTADGVAAEWSQPLAHGAQMGLMMGFLRESDTVLGARGLGALRLNDDAPTQFAGLSMDVPLGEHLSLAGSLYMGWTRAEARSDSLFRDVSALRSDSASLGLLGRGLMDKSDRYGLALHQPLRIADGDARMTLTTGRDRDGRLHTRDLALSLAPSGREIDLQAFYSLGAADTGGRLDVNALLRHEPGHIDGAPPEAVGLLRWSAGL